MELLAYKELTQSDVLQLRKALAENPVIHTYLEVLAHNAAMDIATKQIAPEESPEEYIRAQMYTKGQLDLLHIIEKAIEVAQLEHAKA